MAKTTSQTSKAKSSTADIPTIHGDHVPVADVQHIAPALRPFAVRVDSLMRDPRNARVHTEADLPSTAASLQRFGQQHLLHFDPATRVIKIGNGRHEAAETILGWTWIAAVPSNLTAAELRAFALSDNRTAEKSAWNLDALADELAALADDGIDALDDLGFGADDLADLEAQLSGPADGSPADGSPADGKTAGTADGKSAHGGSGSAAFRLIVDCPTDDARAALAQRLRGEGFRAWANDG